MMVSARSNKRSAPEDLPSMPNKRRDQTDSNASFSMSPSSMPISREKKDAATGKWPAKPAQESASETFPPPLNLTHGADDSVVP